MDQLVKKLSTGKHAVLFEPRTEALSEIKERLSQGFVFVKFTGTQGGSELGINLDSPLTFLDTLDFEAGKGTFQVTGTCQLNFHKVRLFADIDLASRQGIGYLEVLDKPSGQFISNTIQ